MSHMLQTGRGSWLALALALAAPARADFTDVTVAAGVDYVQQVAQAPPNCIFGLSCETDMLTGGAAVADVDGDGFLDLLVTRLDAPPILFRNRGDGTFEDATAGSGLELFDLQSNGAVFGDIDNDGDPDLYVTVVGAPGDPVNGRGYLFVNQGTGVFSEEAAARGVDVSDSDAHRNFSATFGDYDRDGFLDLHTTEWLTQDESETRLLHNRGAEQPGFFDDVTVAAGVALPFVHAFGSAFTDLDDDGWPDLAISADFGTSRLLWNNGDGSFSDGTGAAGVGTDENGMGSTFGDWDGDGDLDWFVTSIFDANQTCETTTCNWGYSGNRLYRNDGNRAFGDATDAAGVRNGYWGWGTAFFDMDNDADLDLVMTNGVDFDGPTADDLFNDDPMRLWRNDGTGVMTEVSALEGLTDTSPGKGLLVFDYDEDGDLDLFVVNNAQGPRLYRNELAGGNGWLRVRAVGTASNRDGRGARVRVQAVTGGPEQVREIGTSTHFLGQSELTAHFGLGPGAGPVASVVVEWPSGLTNRWSDVERNTTLVATETAVDVPLLPQTTLAWLAAALLATALLGRLRAG